MTFAQEQVRRRIQGRWQEYRRVEALRRAYDKATCRGVPRYRAGEFAPGILDASIEAAPACCHEYAGSEDVMAGNQTCGGGRRVTRKRIGGV